MDPLENQSEHDSSGMLDGVLGTLNSTVDLWRKWQGAKVENLKERAAIPSTVIQPSVNGGINQTTLLYIVGGILAAVLVLPMLLGRKSA